jgi:hypothetical protein
MQCHNHLYHVRLIAYQKKTLRVSVSPRLCVSPNDKCSTGLDTILIEVAVPCQLVSFWLCLVMLFC